MSDETTREAVERVRKSLAHKTDDAFVCDLVDGPFSADDVWMTVGDIRTVLAALEDALEDCDDLGAVLTLAQQEAATVDSNHRAEVDAATTAERDRIRAPLDRMKRTHRDDCPPGRLCVCGASGYNAALADVARIIDAEGV